MSKQYVNPLFLLMVDKMQFLRGNLNMHYIFIICAPALCLYMANGIVNFSLKCSGQLWH